MQTFKEYYQNNFEGSIGNKALLPEAERVYHILKTTKAILAFSEKPSVERNQIIPELENYERMKFFHILGYAIRYAMYVEKEGQKIVRQMAASHQNM